MARQYLRFGHNLDLVKPFLGVRTFTYTGTDVQYGVDLPKRAALISKMQSILQSLGTAVGEEPAVVFDLGWSNNGHLHAALDVYKFYVLSA